jgi:hypothetical protein
MPGKKRIRHRGVGRNQRRSQSNRQLPTDDSFCAMLEASITSSGPSEKSHGLFGILSQHFPRPAN